jgi:hypothetical protein
MKFVIAILGLLGSLSAQIICRSVDSKGIFDLFLFGSKEIAGTVNDLPTGIYLFTHYDPHSVRCLEHVQGTFGLNNGKIVHGHYVEGKPFEEWMSDADFCSPSRTRGLRFRFSEEVLQRQRPEARIKSMTIPAEFCMAVER